jgi:hypothetical protein
MEQEVPDVLVRKKFVYRLPAVPLVSPGVRLSWLVRQVLADPAVMPVVGEDDLVGAAVGPAVGPVVGALEVGDVGVVEPTTWPKTKVGTATATNTPAAASAGTPHLWATRPFGAGASWASAAISLAVITLSGSGAPACSRSPRRRSMSFMPNLLQE